MLLVVIISGSLFTTIYSVMTTLPRVKLFNDARMQLIEQSNDVMNRFAVLFQDYTIDYEEYFNRERVGTGELKDEYYNMGEIIKDHMYVVDIAKQAMENLGIKPLIKAIRGGTDGSKISFMGLPTPNIFAGGENFHGKYEFVALESMEKATDVIVEIAKLNAER